MTMTICEAEAKGVALAMRMFDSGATRDSATNKPDYRGFLSPVVLRRFGQYMLEHQQQADGKLRDSDNWRRGIPRKEYLSSLLRHVMDVWERFETECADGNVFEDALCACFFNVQGLLHETIKARSPKCAGFTKTVPVS